MSAPGLRALAARGPVHFMGVGGAGMSPLAEMVLRSGGTVTGCDLAQHGPEVLTRLGMHYAAGHDPARTSPMSPRSS